MADQGECTWPRCQVVVTESLVDRVVQGIERTVGAYSRLIVLVAPAGSGKTAVLQDVQRRTGAPLLDVNLEISRRMLELTDRQRELRAPFLLPEVLDEIQADVVLLDNIELLFDPSLKIDQMRLLREVSRYKTVVVTWSGSCDDDSVLYAERDHREYGRYSTRGVLVVTCQVA